MGFWVAQMTMLEMESVLCSDGSLRLQGFSVASQPQFEFRLAITFEVITSNCPSIEKSSVVVCERHCPGGGPGNIGQL